MTKQGVNEIVRTIIGQATGPPSSNSQIPVCILRRSRQAFTSRNTSQAVLKAFGAVLTRPVAVPAKAAT